MASWASCTIFGLLTCRALSTLCAPLDHARILGSRSQRALLCGSCILRHGCTQHSGPQMRLEMKFAITEACIEPFFRAHTDNGGEFTPKAFQQLLREVCAFPTTAAPCTPRATGVIERGIQALKDKVTRALVRIGRRRVRRVGDAVAIILVLSRCQTCSLCCALWCAGWCDDMGEERSHQLTEAYKRREIAEAGGHATLVGLKWEDMLARRATRRRLDFGRKRARARIRRSRRLPRHNLVTQIRQRVNKLDDADASFARFKQYGPAFLVQPSESAEAVGALGRTRHGQS